MEKDTKIIQEGSAKIHLKTNEEENNHIKEVFYNPVQIFNRDISLLVTQLYINKKKKIKEEEEKKQNFEGIDFYDALTASGLRALRVRQELDDKDLKSVTACDLSESALNIFNKNLILNNLEKDPKMKFVLGDTNKHLFSSDNMYDVIDVDPYGSVVPFLYSTFRGIKNNGLLCLTCTDTRVLFGSDKHKCFYLYRSCKGGSDSIQETGLRILLQTINTVANSQNKNIKVLLSVQSDFYVRVFLEVLDGKKHCWKSINQIGLQFYCRNCTYQHIHRFGEEKKNGYYVCNKFELSSNCCPFCKSNLVVSILTRRTSLVGSSL